MVGYTSRKSNWSAKLGKTRKYRGSHSHSPPPPPPSSPPPSKKPRLSIGIPNIKTRMDTFIQIHLRPLMDESDLRRIFEEIFTIDEGYSVEIDGNFINVYLTEIDSEKSKIRCLEMVLQEYEKKYAIYILHLNNCEVSSRMPELGKGGLLLKKLVSNIRKYEEFETVNVIIDMDASEIIIHDIHIPLGVLQILCYGESWYNKLGFKEIGYEDNVIAMQIYINEPINLRPKNQDKKDILKGLGYRPNILKKDLFQKINQRIKKISSISSSKDASIENELKYYKDLLIDEDKKIRKIFRSLGTDKISHLVYDFSNNSV